SGTVAVRQKDCAGERAHHSRRGQGQLGCHVRMDRLEPKRETPQARSQNRLQASGIGCASIDSDDEEVSETQSLRCCRSTGSGAAKFGSRDATADSLWQQGRRDEAWRPLWLGWMVCPTWSRSFCIRRAWMAVRAGLSGTWHRRCSEYSVGLSRHNAVK